MHDIIARARELIRQIYDVETIIRVGGTGMIAAIVFAETGLMVGFFLPGDSLLVTAGILTRARPELLGVNIWVLLAAITACAIIGDQVGYLTGRKIGHSLFKREDSFLFRKSHVRRAHDFYEKYGAKTIVIARFVPIVRTFAPIVAGVAEMSYPRFVSYNIVGGILWVWSMILGGYALAQTTEALGFDIRKHLHTVILAVVFLSILPAVYEFWKEKRRPHAAPTIAPGSEAKTGEETAPPSHPLPEKTIP